MQEVKGRKTRVARQQTQRRTVINLIFRNLPILIKLSSSCTTLRKDSTIEKKVAFFDNCKIGNTSEVSLFPNARFFFFFFCDKEIRLTFVVVDKAKSEISAQNVALQRARAQRQYDFGA